MVGGDGAHRRATRQGDGPRRAVACADCGRPSGGHGFGPAPSPAASLPASVRTIFITSLAAGVIISVLVVLEYAGNLTVLSFLENFRPGVALVGSQVRAAGPFQYPTIASMYLEIVFAFGLGLLPRALTIGRRGTAFALLAVLLFIGEAIVLTFTRAGLLAMAGSALVVGGLQLKRHGTAHRWCLRGSSPFSRASSRCRPAAKPSCR